MRKLYKTNTKIRAVIKYHIFFILKVRLTISSWQWQLIHGHQYKFHTVGCTIREEFLEYLGSNATALATNAKTFMRHFLILEKINSLHVFLSE